MGERTATSGDLRPLAVGLRDAARLLGVSERTVWGLVSRGELAHRRCGRRVLIPVRAIEQYLSGASEVHAGD